MHTKAFAATLLLFSISAAGHAFAGHEPPIDRQALVSRHNVVLTQFDGERPLSVGNGEFAFNMDITGLQTFVPFNTMSHWAWHSGSPPAGASVADYQEPMVKTHGRDVAYPLFDPKRPEISGWLASAPHALNLGRIGLVLTKKNGETATLADIAHPHQELDLWRGVVTSRFEFEGYQVVVETACHPELDAVGVRIESPLIPEERLAVFAACPGNNPMQFANFVGDWANPGRFEALREAGEKEGEKEALRRADFRRQIDEHVSYFSLVWEKGEILDASRTPAPALKIVAARYGAQDRWLDVTRRVADGVRDGRAVVHAGNSLGADPAPQVRKSLEVTYAVGDARREASVEEGADLVIDAAPWRHRITLLPETTSGKLAFVAAFSAKPLPVSLPDANEVFRAAEAHWPEYWKSGGAIDLSQSADPRWRELERRIVLSQYLMGVHEAGSQPPQESGLVNNGWFGRFHMEMVWWHSAHWALWGRWEQLDRSIGIYQRILSTARARAERQGYRGARWPKCIGPEGREWPHEIHAFLIWQQPHPIFFAELDYRAHPTRETLEKWSEVVEATADFIASYAHHDVKSDRYVLGPPIHLVSENSPPLTTQNPAFELGYWRFGLRVAQEWRERMGLARKAEWDAVVSKLSPLPVQDGVYVLHEGVQDMWTKWNFEHPALIGTLGMLPGDGTDRATMERTLQQVAKTWNFNHTWGWDFPMLAMTAARIGQPAQALDFLLTAAPGFQFDERGLATGGPFPYFPSNGGLLYAAAMMAAGWDGAPQRKAPGFPDDGTWTVRYEGLRPAP